MNSEAHGGSALGPIVDSDVDSLYVLPLSAVPFQTDTLRGARLVKNQRMENVVEVYADRGVGSAQVDISALPRHLNWKNESRGDYELLQKLSDLPSFDVYTVRRSFQAMDIQAPNLDDLKLSKEKKRQLDVYMQRFTLPLIRRIYGESAQDVQRLEDIIGLLRDPDVKKALGRLKQMAEKLNIAVEEIPNFIEDYADCFLSLSYYNQCLDRVTPLMDRFASAVNSMRLALMVRQDPKLGNEIGRQEKTFSGLVKFLQRMFQQFDTLSGNLWDNLSAATFGRLRASIDNAEKQMASLLCGLTVKLNAWISRFPVPKAATAQQMIEFIMSEMRPGTPELLAVARGEAA